LPPASQTEHNGTGNTALPYISNYSIISTSPHFIPGSQNVLTGLRQWSERRPGFSTTIAANWKNLARHFVWQKWGGAFFHMFCDLTPVAKVYKIQVGLDANPVLIWTSASAEPFDFVVSNNTCYFGNGTDMRKYDGTTETKWGITSPAAAPMVTLVSGTMNVYTSWSYTYTYFNSVTQHESSPSPISIPLTPFGTQNPRIAVIASADPQVTNIRIYRTTDGGAQDPALMQELSNSPFPNTSTTHDDTTLDINLSLRVAPEFLTNDPPPPAKGFVAYAGRIWSFLNNTGYYSGFEEIANGVPEESWPSGLGGNFYPFDKEIFALASLIDGVALFTAARIYKIEGDTLDTFRRYTLLERRGTRSRTTVTSLGGSVAWLDTSNTLWISDLGEVGLPIRPDIQNINPLTAYIAIHISGIYHWLVLLDGTNGILYIYDLDTNQWLTPWTVGTSGSALVSGETSIGNVQLMFARNTTKSLQMTSGTYNDDGNLYIPKIKTNMYRLTPDNNPSFKGVHDWSEIKTDTHVPTQVLQLTDDDPTTAGYVDITANGQPSPDIQQGGNLLTTRWTSNYPQAQMMSMQFVWPAAEANFFLYQMDEAFHPSGG